MDFPATTIGHPVGACIHVGHFLASTFGPIATAGQNWSAVAAPAANLALYIPFNIDRDTIAKQMFWENGAVAGTTDVGIYDSNKKRLVSSGPTANAGTIQIANIADTILVPGLYYMAWLPSTVATQTYWCGTTTGHTVASLRASGVQQQAVGSATLPDPAVFAVIANAYLPLVGIDFTGSM